MTCLPRSAPRRQPWRFFLAPSRSNSTVAVYRSRKIGRTVHIRHLFLRHLAVVPIRSGEISETSVPERIPVEEAEQPPEALGFLSEGSPSSTTAARMQLLPAQLGQYVLALNDIFY